MREILFRGKNIDSGKWVYGSFIPDMTDLSGKNNLCDWGFIKPFGKTREERYMQYVKKETIGQYTGLTDKNGRRIYEGDIVAAYKNGEEKFINTITFRNGCFWFGNWNFPEFLQKYRNYEIIGNIHDNPELLKT